MTMLTMRADHWPPGSRINHTDHLQWEIFEHNCDTKHRADDVPKYDPEQRRKQNHLYRGFYKISCWDKELKSLELDSTLSQSRIEF